MITHYWRILKDAEKRAERSLRLQVKVPGPFQGGFLDEHGLVEGKFAIYRITTAVGVYCNPDSCYYQDLNLFKMIQAGLEFVKRCQNEFGRFDLISCNFDSAPDTAFCVKRLLPAFHYLALHGKTEAEQSIFQEIQQIVEKGARGMMEGGFHTPNHRWAIASNLLECAEIFHDQGMRKAAEIYLQEGIDCNEDGEYTEKSAGNYNRINNDAIITIGDCTGDETYYGYAVRNLKMMLCYLEPDGSIFTENSTRQDKGQKVYPRDYYLQYLDMGLRQNIPEFLDAANWIFEQTEKMGQLAPDCLLQLMNHPELKQVEHGTSGVPEWYTRYFKESGILRARRKYGTYTVMAGQSGFFHLAGRNLSLQVKLCGSFFRYRSFCPDAFLAENLEESKVVCRLNQKQEGWYYLPFQKKPETSDWWKMGPDKREKRKGPVMEISAEIREEEDGLEIALKAAGVSHAPYRVEIEVQGAEWLWNQHIMIPAENGKSAVIREGKIYLSSQEETVEIGPGFGEHMYTDGRFGSEPHSNQAFTVFFTGYTELDNLMQIRIHPEGMRITGGENEG